MIAQEHHLRVGLRFRFEQYKATVRRIEADSVYYQFDGSTYTNRLSFMAFFEKHNPPILLYAFKEYCYKCIAMWHLLAGDFETKNNLKI